MAKSKQEKSKIIEDLKEKLTEQKSVILVDFSGVNSKILFQLKKEFKKTKGFFQVVKKTLLKKALDSLKKKDLSEKIENIEGQLALAYGFADEMLPAKICYNFSKENENLKILGGIFDNEFVVREKVIELAQLPSREELLARLTGSLQNSLSSFVNVLQGNIKGLVCALNAIKETK